MERLIFFDTETTGLSPASGHRIVEIGCVELLDGVITENIFHRYINPERDIPYEATKIHGITSNKVKNCPRFFEVIKDFFDFIKNSTLIAHNADFDVRFINFQLQMHDFGELTNKIIDTLKIARKKFPGQGASLDALCKRYNVSIAGRNLHGALLDSTLLAHVYMRMMYSQSGLWGITSSAIHEKKEEMNIRTTRNCGLATPDELIKHEIFKKSFKMWEGYS